jgi:hypothetical protein
VRLINLRPSCFFTATRTPPRTRHSNCAAASISELGNETVPHQDPDHQARKATLPAPLLLNTREVVQWSTGEANNVGLSTPVLSTAAVAFAVLVIVKAAAQRLRRR